MFSHQELHHTPAAGSPEGGDVPFPPVGKEGSYIDNGWEMRRMLQRDGRVLACFAGHKHRNRWTVRDGVHYITLAALHWGGSFAKVTLSDGLHIEGAGEQRSYRLTFPGGKSARPPLYVSFTMDCERIRGECFCGGPDKWELSEKAIRGFCDTLLAGGFPPTLFIVPETAERHAPLFKALAARGVELGMHLHPQCFQDHRYDRYLGAYDAAECGRETRGTGEGIEAWTRALGGRPRAFRPGNFSASDATFGVLYDLGFRHGSLSDPGRHVPKFHAEWNDATPHAHWANAKNRLIPGELGFFEAPLTTDPSRRRPNGFPYELRIESGPFDKWHKPIIEKALAHIEADNVTFRVLSVFTHNYLDYTDPANPRTQVLHDYVAYLKRLNARYEVIGATLATIRQRFAKHTGKP